MTDCSDRVKQEQSSLHSTWNGLGRLKHQGFKSEKQTGNTPVEGGTSSYLSIAVQIQLPRLKCTLHGERYILCKNRIQRGNRLEYDKEKTIIVIIPQVKKRTESHVLIQLDFCSCSDRAPGRAGASDTHIGPTGNSGWSRGAC